MALLCRFSLATDLIGMFERKAERHPSHELIVSKGFSYVVFCPAPESLYCHGFIPVGGHEHDRYGGSAFFNFSQNIEAGHIAQPGFEDHEMDLVGMPCNPDGVTSR